MKRPIYGLITVVFVLLGCATKKEAKTELPFSLGQVYSQRWIVEENPEEIGYDVIIPIRILNTRRATLQKLYHRGKSIDVKIELRKIGAVAVAEYPMEILHKTNRAMGHSSENRAENISDRMSFPSLPFQLTEAQAVLTYLEDGEIKYFKIESIRQNPIMSYPSLSLRNFE
jgi:hypothetical protein